MKLTSARLWLLGALFLLMVRGRGQAADAGLKVHSQLVWGTDGAKPDGQDLPELDAKLKGKLGHLRWKNYWVVKAQDTEVATKDAKQGNQARLGKCLVELRRIGNSQIEVKIFNAGPEKSLKLIQTVCEPIEKLKNGGAIVIGGDSKDTWNDAWLVVLTESP
jgi:hypothetical protein